MTINPYPMPNTKKKLASRFSTGKKDSDGEDILAPAELDAQVVSFHYDPISKISSVELTPVDSGKKNIIPPYLPGKELIELVRLMQIIKRPVILKGEPGSGKTQLAKAVAYEWYGADYQKYYFEWHIKSNAKATDGLYTFDHLKRLRDAQMAQFKAKEEGITAAEKEDLYQYRKFGPLGQAFLTSTEDRPAILLIDEIDKADIDFPNDLLLELDEQRFKIPDTGEYFEAKYPPLIFITSNDERELPEAFLRRCLFMYTQFPEPKQLRGILRAHIPRLFDIQTAFVEAAQASTDPATDTSKDSNKLVNAAIERFKKLRDDIKNDPADNKRVSTSELIDWMKAYVFEITDKKGMLKGQNTALTSLDRLPLYFQTLLKTYRGYQREILEKAESPANKP